MAKKPAASAAEPEALVEYIVETTMGHVTVDPEKVVGKSDAELEAWLSSDDYLSRLGAHNVVKIARQSVYKRTI